MLLLKEQIKTLEKDLCSEELKISPYHDLPFAIFRYDPELEFEMRKEISLLAIRLNGHGKKVHIISLADLFFEAMEKEGGKEQIIKEEKEYGFLKAQESLNIILSDPEYAPLSDLLVDRLKNMDSEKKDRIINAAIEEFSLYPYEKASTNNIVNNAKISKGLLFHYFGNKKGLYEKLIGFVMNKLFDEITSQIDWNEKDVFERIKLLVIVKIKLGQVYPNMFAFLLKVLSDNNTNNMSDINDFYEKYGVDIQTLLGEIFTKNVDFSLFRDQNTIDKAINIIRWTMEKYSEENLQQLENTKEIDYDKISTELDTYISVLKSTLYK
jgi:AcrR family transcriptional regulator